VQAVYPTAVSPLPQSEQKGNLISYRHLFG
jgi:hypothetical protein